MANAHLVERLSGIQEALVANHRIGQSQSDASRGAERELFLREYLAKVLPRPFRLGSGDIVDCYGEKSGQIDVVIEYPFLPSVPGLAIGAPRLYLAEGVVAVIEVKSDLAKQWNQVEPKVRQVKRIKRKSHPVMTTGIGVPEDIPAFVVGYTGWKSFKGMRERLLEADLDGLLVIERGLYLSSTRTGAIRADGPEALWGLICSMHDIATAMKHSADSPSLYMTASSESEKKELSIELARGISEEISVITGEFLDLGDPRITDELARPLSDVHTVRVLNLSGTQITDKAVSHLAKLHQLRKLYVRRTRLSDAAVAELRAALPNLEVIR